jgi:hypothetical protein
MKVGSRIGRAWAAAHIELASALDWRILDETSILEVYELA